VGRAKQAIEQADRLLLMVDGSTTTSRSIDALWPLDVSPPPPADRLVVVFNKIDITGHPAHIESLEDSTVIHLSAKTAVGMDLLRQHLKASVGFNAAVGGGFSARRRHLTALVTAQEHLRHAQQHQKAGELLAEELRLAQQALSTITGKAWRADDLLGEIFSQFCIGK